MRNDALSIQSMEFAVSVTELEKEERKTVRP